MFQINPTGTQEDLKLLDELTSAIQQLLLHAPSATEVALQLGTHIDDEIMTVGFENYVTVK